MIRDLLHTHPESLSGADVCIAGAGAAGIVLAVQMARCGKRVLLLEGGGLTLEEAAQEPYRSEISGLPHRGIHDGRFRVKGGTTTKWGGQILELDELDFEQRAWIPGSGWPFPKKELTPFYKTALELEGVHQAIAEDGAVWRALKQPEPRFAEMQSYLSRWCPEPDFSRLHRVALAESPAIQLWVHANAVELLLDGGTVTGLRARTQTGKEAIFRARDYVFCLGAIESSRFFLQPREGRLPWNCCGLLGRHFQDHIDCNAAALAPRSRKGLHRAFDSIFLNGYKYQPKVKLTPEFERSNGTLNAAATLAFESGLDEVLTAMRTTAKRVLRGRVGEVSPADAWQMVRNAPSLLRQSYRYAVAHRGYQPASARISLRVHCEQEPCSQSAITLTGERDSLGLLRTNLSWKISPLELHTIRRFVELAQRSFGPLAEVVPGDSLPGDSVPADSVMDSDDRLTGKCEDSFHHMGGMRMHASPSQGVVDTELKLHGTSNAWVCSSAVFPTSGFSNPTHTLVALTARLAQRLCS